MNLSLGYGPLKLIAWPYIRTKKYKMITRITFDSSSISVIAGPVDNYWVLQNRQVSAAGEESAIIFIRCGNESRREQ